MKPAQVLMVGGPADGRWMVTKESIIEVAQLEPLRWDADAPSDFKRVRYYLEPFTMFGFTVNVAICQEEFMGSNERNRAVIKALFQRDVAQTMLGSWP